MTPQVPLSKRIAAAWHALFDTRTSFQAKAVLVAAILYGISPIDLIPDLLPLFGIADDSLLGILAVMVFLRMTKHIRTEWLHKHTSS